MKIQIDTTKEIDKKLNIEKSELEIKSKADMVMYILKNYYGVKQKRKKNERV